MIAHVLARLRSGCMLLGSLGCTVVAGRLMVSSQPSWLLPETPNSAPARNAQPAAKAAASFGPWRSVRLSVTAGPPRSAVVAEGRQVGYSPYLGDFRCREGESVRVEVRPLEGEPIVREARCERDTLHIE